MDKLSINWIGGMKFEATPPSGHKVVLDAYKESGGEDSAPRPYELMPIALGSCTAMDVISILRKKRQDVTEYRIEVEYQQREGDYPKPIVFAKVIHILKGNNIDTEAVKRAVELSEEKYCSVAATLREQVEVTAEFRIEE